MSFVSDSIILGLFEAAPLILAACGFTLIYYLNGFINVAYSETITIGAYVAVTLNSILGMNFYLAIIPSALISGAFSVLTYYAVFRPAGRRGVASNEMIILSVGLSFFLRYAVRLIFGTQIYQFDAGSPRYLSFLGIGITSIQIIALLIVAAVCVGLYWFIYKTNYGEMMRGLAGDVNLAAASGISPTRVSALIWFIAGCAGGLAGVFFGVFSFVNSLMGWRLILIIIMISIVGGVGNVRGALIASIAAGVITAAVVMVTQPLYGNVILLVTFIIVLIFKQARSH